MYLNLNVLVSHFKYVQYYYMRATSQLLSCNLAIIVRCRRIFIIDIGTLNTLLYYIIILIVGCLLTQVRTKARANTICFVIIYFPLTSILQNNDNRCLNMNFNIVDIFWIELFYLRYDHSISRLTEHTLTLNIMEQDISCSRLRGRAPFSLLTIEMGDAIRCF